MLQKSAVLSSSIANSSDSLFIVILLPIYKMLQRQYQVQQLSLFSTPRIPSPVRRRGDCRATSSRQLCLNTMHIVVWCTSQRYIQEESLARDVELFDHNFEWCSRRRRWDCIIRLCVIFCWSPYDRSAAPIPNNCFLENVSTDTKNSPFELSQAQ